MGAVLLAFLFLGLLRRYRPDTVVEGQALSVLDSAHDAARREELVATLAALDEHHEAGGMEQDDYDRRRAALVDRALGIESSSEE